MLAKRILDVLYVPPCSKPSQDIVPINVEIQRIVDINFIKRINKYSLNVYDTKVVVFVIKGYSSKALQKDYISNNARCFLALENQYWAQSIHFYDLNSIYPSLIHFILILFL